MPPATCTDVHAHLFPEGLPDLSSTEGGHRWPTLAIGGDGAGAIHQDGRVYRQVDRSYWAAEPRLAWMTGLGIDRQVVSPLPILLTYWAPPRAALDFARRQNEAIASLVAQAPDRLVGFGTVPLQDPQLAAEELDRIVALGLAGVEIGTRAGEQELDAADIRPFFAAAADKGVPLLLHALEGAGLGRMDNLLVRFGIGVPADTGIAAAMLFLGGVLAELPGLRICICHGGGSFFWSLPRLRPLVRRVMGSEAEERLVAAVQSVFVDTASMGPENLDYLLQLLPADRLVLGSDYPATQHLSPLEAIASPRFDEVRDAVLADNAAAFLGC